jgi:hypothetical protein
MLSLLSTLWLQGEVVVQEVLVVSPMLVDQAGAQVGFYPLTIP